MLDSNLAELRKLGRIDEEKQGGEEVSQQYVDLTARLDNGRHTEKRLNELLAKRADRLKDVLDVERELASTREEIERMEAEQRNMLQQVNYASIELKLRQEYKPALNFAPPAAHLRMRNALVDVSCLSWKWRKRSSVKITERTYEEATEALHTGRKSRHSEEAFVGRSADLRSV